MTILADSKKRFLWTKSTFYWIGGSASGRYSGGLSCEKLHDLNMKTGAMAYLTRQYFHKVAMCGETLKDSVT